MKYLLLFLSIFIYCHMVTAQAVTDITASSPSLYWYNAHDPCSLNGCTHSETAEHFIGHDTVIHGITYAVTYDSLQRRHMRMDAQHRVYALDPNDTVESLL